MLSTETTEALATIAEEQLGAFLVIPVQFGRRYQGWSVNMARRSFEIGEFGLHGVAIAAIALCYPQLLFGDDDRILIALGENSPGPEGACPALQAGKNGLRFRE